MPKCAFPNCDRPGCPFCRGKQKQDPVPAVKKRKPLPKQKKPIPKESEKRKKAQPVYRKIVKEMASVSEWCEIRAPKICTGIMQGANHKQKRSPNNLLNPANLERACNACNNWIEHTSEGQAWAKENGHFISRFSKNFENHSSTLP